MSAAIIAAPEMLTRNGRLKICLLGQHFWASRMRDTLLRYAGDHVAVSTLFPQRFPARDAWRQAASADLLVRIGFRPGATTPFGILFDSFWTALRRSNKSGAAAYYWIGTDVLNAVRDVQRNRARKAFWDSLRDIHMVDAPWLRAELAGIGVNARQIHFPAPILKSTCLPDLPSRFTVLTYIPDRRYRFYAGPTIYKAAQLLPEIQFNVVSGQGKWVKQPLPNLTFYGWQQDMTPMYQNCSILLRMPQHDALGATVQEGLCFGRHVIYNYPVPFTNQVAFGDLQNLVVTLKRLYAQHAAGRLQPNEEGWRYASNEYDESKFTNQLVHHLQCCLQGRSIARAS